MSLRLKVVFDTNIYLSAIIFGGNPRRCLEFARERSFDLFVSKEILIELTRVFKRKFRWKKEEIREVVEGILLFTKIVSPKRHIQVIKTDPSDNRILECAKEIGADYIVSGDIKHLLSLHHFENIPILSAKQFLDKLYKKN